MAFPLPPTHLTGEAEGSVLGYQSTKPCPAAGEGRPGPQPLAPLTPLAYFHQSGALRSKAHVKISLFVLRAEQGYILGYFHCSAWPASMWKPSLQ